MTIAGRDVKWPYRFLVSVTLAAVCSALPAWASPGAGDDPAQGRAWLGVGISASEGEDGVNVVEVFEGSPAEAAGVKEGDVIISLDGQETKDAGAVTAFVGRHHPGDRVTLLLIRDGDKKTFEIVLGSRKSGFSWITEDDDEIEQEGEAEGEAEVDIWLPELLHESLPEGVLEKRLVHIRHVLEGPWIGVSMNDLTPDLRRHFGAPEDSGALIARVTEDSPAARAGIKAGDVLVSVDGRAVKSPSDVSAAIRKKKAGDKVEMKLVRDRREITETVELAERPEGAMAIGPLRLKESGELGEQLRKAYKLREEELGKRIEALQKEMEALQARLDEMMERLREKGF
jgi:predicted metalloprotease with PDZ domain